MRSGRLRLLPVRDVADYMLDAYFSALVLQKLGDIPAIGMAASS
jgi:hypothetical protein